MDAGVRHLTQEIVQFRRHPIVVVAYLLAEVPQVDQQAERVAVSLRLGARLGVSGILYFANPWGYTSGCGRRIVTPARDFRSDSTDAITWCPGKLWSLWDIMINYSVFGLCLLVKQLSAIEGDLRHRVTVIRSNSPKVGAGIGE